MSKFYGSIITGVFLCLTCAAAALPAHSQTGLLNPRSAMFLSHEGNQAYLLLGVGLPLLRDGASGGQRTLRAADTLITSAVFSEVLKRMFGQKRPDDSGERNSFPSGHATAAFAVATIQAEYHPREAPLWYVGAALIADSRVTLKRHRPRDVIAGAALGAGTAVWEQSEPRGLVLAPFIRPERKGFSAGFRGVF